MTLKTRLSVLLLSTPILVFVIVGGLMGNAAARTTGDETFQHLRVFDDVVQLVVSNYVEEVKIDKAMDGALRGLTDALDPDSAYLPTRLVAEARNASLPEGSVGIELTRQYYLRVIAARDGSSAAKAGLQTGDYVRAIDGKPTREMSVFEGTRLLHGQPGTKVVLTIFRGNAADPHEFTLVREKNGGPLVTGRMLDGGIGYIRIAAFDNGVDEQLRREIGTLQKAGAKSLAIDIRRTAEGSIDNGVAAARLFVKSGTLTSRAGRKKPTAANDKKKEPEFEVEQTVTAKAGDGAIELPAVLLVTAGSAGAAEVFAAALHDNKRADLIGEHTIGRAGVQHLVPLPENRGLWLTYLRYLTPAGEPLHGKGLEATVVVEEPDVEFGMTPPTNDAILDAALEYLKKKAV